MKKVILAVVLSCAIIINSSAQQVIPTENLSKKVEVALTSTKLASPMEKHEYGKLVYNTATVGDVKPGYYLNNGEQWIAIDEKQLAILRKSVELNK